MSKENPTKYDRYRLKDVEAYRKKKRDWARTKEQREKRTEYMRLWRAKNRERHNELARQSHQKNRHKHIEKNKNRHYLRKYGITLEQKLEMIKLQNNMCAICSKIFSNSKNAHLDHCHKTNKIRGILCTWCNTKLGWYEATRDDVELYLNKTKI